MTVLISILFAIYANNAVILWRMFDRSDFASDRDHVLSRLTILLWPLAAAFSLAHDLAVSLVDRVALLIARLWS